MVLSLLKLRDYLRGTLSESLNKLSEVLAKNLKTMVHAKFQSSIRTPQLDSLIPCNYDSTSKA